MKMLSVLVSCALLLTACQLAAALRHAGVLPAARSSAGGNSQPAPNLSSSNVQPHLDIHRN